MNNLNSQTIPNTNNVINAVARFQAAKCPPGSMVWCEDLGCSVEILESHGDQRLIQYVEYRKLTGEELVADLPIGVKADEVLSGEMATYHSKTVPVTCLQQWDLRRDVGCEDEFDALRKMAWQ